MLVGPRVALQQLRLASLTGGPIGALRSSSSRLGQRITDTLVYKVSKRNNSPLRTVITMSSSTTADAVPSANGSATASEEIESLRKQVEELKVMAPKNIMLPFVELRIERIRRLYDCCRGSVCVCV